MVKDELKAKTKENVIELKDKQSVIAYLGFLQNVISRMGNNSANIKAVIAVIYTIFATALIESSKLQKYWWAGFIICGFGLILDVYYLSYEKIYRKKYDIFLNKLNHEQLNEEDIYNMYPRNTELKYEVLAVMLEAVKSYSVIGFYILFIGITVLLKFI